VPTTIHADRAARSLSIAWADGHASVYDFTTLRWLCPCAYCRGEAGLPGWLDSAPTLSEAQTQLTDITPVGNYAVAPVWADGHSTGFYTFDLLRDRCPCPECTAGRAAATRTPRGEGRIR
jgi:prepilin-type processing-associated H-X9-DG protein